MRRARRLFLAVAYWRWSPSLAAVALLVAFLLLLGGSSKASAAAPFSPAQEALYQQALVAWGVPAGPPSCASVEREVVAAPVLGAAGRATVPDGPDTQCLLQLADTPYPACATYEILLHEVGHLLGHWHSTDPGSIMYEGGVGSYYCGRGVILAVRRSLQREVRRCQKVQRRECWRGVREERRALGEMEAEAAPRPSLP